MRRNSYQNVLMMCTGALLVCVLLICQPIIETCLKLDDSISLIELDVDFENELEENNLQEIEKDLSFRVIYQLDLIIQNESSDSSSFFTKNYWVSHSQDIFIHPPELIS